MIFWLGVFGGSSLVIGSALPEKTGVTPLTSKRNWLFAVGNISIFLYALLNWYFQSAPIFFVILEILILVSTVLMLRPVNEKLTALIFMLSGGALGLWSLSLFAGYETLIFVAGLAVISLGFALPPQHLRRNFLLALGSALIAWFSYLGAAWIFFWLNTFFAIFSGYYFLQSNRS